MRSTLLKRIIILSALILIVIGVVLLRAYPPLGYGLTKISMEFKKLKLAKNEFFLNESGGYKLIIPNQLFELPNTTFEMLLPDGLFMQINENERVKIMEFRKFAPNTMKGAVTAMATNKTKLSKGCSAIQIDENRWIIGSLGSEKMVCGPYADPYDDEIITRYFTLIHGFVAFVDVPKAYKKYFEELENGQFKKSTFKIESIK